MRSRSAEKGFSLLEAVVAAGVMAVGIVFMFRAFAVSLDSVRRAGDMEDACALAENVIWEASLRQMHSSVPIPALSGTEKISGRTLSWTAQSVKSGTGGLFDLSAGVSWNRNRLDIAAKALGN